MPHTYRDPRPALTADAVVFTLVANELHLLLVQRGLEPFAGSWALPGGFCREHEPTELCVGRELHEETGLAGIWLEQLKTFDRPGRDPRGWIVSVAYVALIDGSRVTLEHASGASDAKWWPVRTLPALAFDHREIVDYALSRLRNKLRWSNIGAQLLPPLFTMGALQRLHEAVLGDTLEKPLDKRNFQKRMLESGTVQDTGQTLNTHRRGPRPRLYSFAPRSQADQPGVSPQAVESGLPVERSSRSAQATVATAL